MFTRILIAGAVSALIGLIYFGIINIPAIKRNIGKVPHWVGILVVIAAGRVFEPMVTTAWEAFQLPTQTESALLEVAVFRTIKEQEPKLFQEILQRAIEALRKDRTASLTPITAKYCTKLVLSRIPHADDRAIIEYMRSTMDITRYLDSRSHDQAFAYLFPDRVQYKLPFLADLPKERLERQLGALNGVLVSSFGKQRTIPTETEVQPIMIDVLTGIRDRCDISIFSKLDRQDLDHAETLRTLLAYYDGLFALQEPQAGAVLRVLPGAVGRESMDIHQSLNWKQIVIAVVALYAFGKGFTPIQVFVLTHPVVGLLILAGLIGSWFLYRQARRSRLQT